MRHLDDVPDCFSKHVACDGPRFTNHKHLIPLQSGVGDTLSDVSRASERGTAPRGVPRIVALTTVFPPGAGVVANFSFAESAA